MHVTFSWVDFPSWAELNRKIDHSSFKRLAALHHMNPSERELHFELFSGSTAKSRAEKKWKWIKTLVENRVQVELGKAPTSGRVISSFQPRTSRQNQIPHIESMDSFSITSNKRHPCGRLDQELSRKRWLACLGQSLLREVTMILRYNSHQTYLHGNRYTDTSVDHGNKKLMKKKVSSLNFKQKQETVCETKVFTLASWNWISAIDTKSEKLQFDRHSFIYFIRHLFRLRFFSALINIY